MTLKESQILDFLFGILIRIAEKNGVSFFAGGILRATNEFWKEGVGNGRDDDSDCMTLLGSQAAGYPVGAVLQPFDRAQNPVPGRLRDTGLPIDHRGDGLDRNFGHPGNVDNCRFTCRAHWEDERSYERCYLRLTSESIEKLSVASCQASEASRFASLGWFSVPVPVSVSKDRLCRPLIDDNDFFDCHPAAVGG
jgi:hypothetical protein